MRRWTAGALVLCLGCAGAPWKKGVERGERLSGEERELVLAGTGDAPLPVIQNRISGGNELLRRPSEPVTLDDPALPALVARMRATVAVERGVGIAAPQVGVNKQVVLVQRFDREPERFMQVYYNPEIVERTEAREFGWEGCLSVDAGFAPVERSRAVRIRYQRADGAWQSEWVEGFTARIFQHELDHLDGQLFVDLIAAGALVAEADYRAMKRAGRLGELMVQSAPLHPQLFF